MSNKFQKGFLPIVLWVLLLSSISACGFRLRGAVEVPPELQETNITGIAEFSPLYLELKKVLTRAGAKVVKDKAVAKSTIEVSSEDFKRRVLTVDAQGRVAEYELIYRFNFKIVTNENAVMVPLQKIELNRDYRFDPDNILAKDAEESQIKKEMVSFGVRQAMRRINAVLKSKAASESAS